MACLLHPRPLSLLQRGLAPRSKGKARAELRNKASGGDGIPVELLQILKDDAVKVLHLICQQIWMEKEEKPRDRERRGSS